jgi:hypothetical protein
MVAGSLDPSEGYRLLHELYLGSDGLLAELKPMFRLPGIQPEGHLPADEEFNAAVRSAAAEWLLKNPLAIFRD